MLILLQQMETLHPLADWPYLHGLKDRLIQAARGGEGMTATDTRRIGKWARRWEALPEAHRKFYAAKAHETAAQSALWYLLEGVEDNRPKGPARGDLQRLWEDFHGYKPAESPLP